jgi:hypothetical protein
MWIVYLLFGMVALGIGVGLLLLQHYLSGVEVGPEHGMDDPSNLHLVAFPFLVIAAAFLLAIANKVLASGSQTGSTDGEQTVSRLHDSDDGSQRIPVGVRFAVLFHLPGMVQLGWAFFMGFAFLFLMLEGPAAIVPLGILLTLPVGIVGNYIFNLRVLRLVRNGRIATATGDVQWESPASGPGSTERASSYKFLVDGQIYTVDRRSWVSGRAKTIPVLYSPENPSRNVGLEGRRSAVLLRDASPWPLCLIGVLVPTACIAALVWLWTVV